MLKNKIKIDNVLLPSPESMIKHTIYNWQLMITDILDLDTPTDQYMII